MALHRFQTGDRIFDFPAKTWNRMVAATEKVERIAQRLGRSHQPDSVLSILAKNETGVDLEQGGVGSLESYDLNTRDDVILVAKEPSTLVTLAGGSFGIALDDIPQNEMGRFAIGGVCRANIDITNISLRHADIVNGYATKLESHPAGRVRLLAPATQEGEQLLWVEMNARAPVIWRCLPKANITAGSDGVVDILDRTGAVVGQVTALLDWMDGDEDIEVNTEAMVLWCEHEGRWRFLAADCAVGTGPNPNESTWPNGDAWTWPDTTAMTWT